MDSPPLSFDTMVCFCYYDRNILLTVLTLEFWIIHPLKMNLTLLNLLNKLVSLTEL
jgi:hypothetical protein